MSEVPGPAGDEGMRFFRPAELGGVEATHFDRLTGPWRVFHEHFEFCAVLGGSAEWRYRMGDHTTAPGTTMLLQPGESHVGLRVPAATTARVLHVPHEVFASAALELNAPGAEPRPGPAQVSDPELFATLVALNHSLASDVSALHRQSLLAASLALLLTRHTEQRSAERATDRPAVRRAREYLHAHWADDVDLDAVSGAAFTSKYHLVRVFRAEVGMPPHAYLHLVRIARARALLAAGRRAADVAATCRFSDQAHLTRSFRAAYHITPARYARLVRG